MCSYIAYGIKTDFAKNNLTITQSFAYPEDLLLTDEAIKEYLGVLKVNSRSKVFYLTNVLSFAVLKLHFRLALGGAQ